MTNFADLFAQTFITGDAEPLAARLLHRSQLEDGLDLHIGAAAILAETLALAVAFDDRDATAIAIGDRFAALRLSGIARRLFGHTLGNPGRLTFTRHIWFETEGDYALRLTAISDWGGLATAAGLPFDTLARTLGARHPTHRPLGELTSGRGQHIATPVPLAVRAMLPDAAITRDTSVGNAALYRLQAHIAGRRISLPLSHHADTPHLLDDLAVAATAYRPFHPVQKGA
jgi:hypothetical protein